MLQRLVEAPFTNQNHDHSFSVLQMAHLPSLALLSDCTASQTPNPEVMGDDVIASHFEEPHTVFAAWEGIAGHLRKRCPNQKPNTKKFLLRPHQYRKIHTVNLSGRGWFWLATRVRLQQCDWPSSFPRVYSLSLPSLMPPLQRVGQTQSYSPRICSRDG